MLPATRQWIVGEKMDGVRAIVHVGLESVATGLLRSYRTPSGLLISSPLVGRKIARGMRLEKREGAPTVAIE